MTSRTVPFNLAVESASATDQSFARIDLELRCDLDADRAQFQLTELNLADVADDIVPPDSIGDFETVSALEGAYRRGEAVPPVLVGAHRLDPARTVVLDGHLRLHAAMLAGLTTVPAYQAIGRTEPPTTPGGPADDQGDDQGDDRVPFRQALEHACLDGADAVLDLLRDRLTSEEMVRHIENWIPLGYEYPHKDPYPNITEAARAALTEAVAHLGAPPADVDD